MLALRSLIAAVSFDRGGFRPQSALASFHLWTISEIFSSADGTVQFIELVSSGPAETATGPAEIRTDSGKVWEFPFNLSGSTLNKRLLIATDNFESIPGAVTPNFSASPALPADFFNPASDRIRLFHPTFGEFHSRTFTNVPTDNVFSRVFTPTQTDVANSPQNFTGEVGSINRGDYNSDGIVDMADYVVWRKTFNEPVTPAGRGADGDTDGSVDDGDLAVWTSALRQSNRRRIAWQRRWLRRRGAGTIDRLAGHDCIERAASPAATADSSTSRAMPCYQLQVELPCALSDCIGECGSFRR